MGEEGVDDWPIKGVWVGVRGWLVHYRYVGEEGIDDRCITGMSRRRELMTGPLEVCGGGGNR